MDYDSENRDEDNLAPATIRRGHYAIEREPWGAPFEAAKDQGGFQILQPRSGGYVTNGTWMRAAGPRNSVLLNPEDLIGTQRIWVAVEGILGSHGCCGTAGTMGPNRGCACGAPVATLSADCSTPYEIHLDPRRVVTDPVGRGRLGE